MKFNSFEKKKEDKPFLSPERPVQINADGTVTTLEDYTKDEMQQNSEESNPYR